MFESFQPAPADPILGLTEAFLKDPHPNKINLGSGIYKDDSGDTPTLECIARAEKILAEKATAGGGYLPMTGLISFSALKAILPDPAGPWPRKHPAALAACALPRISSRKCFPAPSSG